MSENINEKSVNQKDGVNQQTDSVTRLNHDITLEEIEAACRAHQKENDRRNMAEECRSIAREQKEKMQKNAEGGLSASYNIGARYFIREILKPLPATERSLLEAKVPAVKSRTSCVYADLRDLISEMELRKAA